MKGKLITIAVLALLLCAAAPMAATAKPTTPAAPTAKPITGPVYYATAHLYSSPMWAKVTDQIVGSAVINNNGRYTYTLTGLTPDQPYNVGWIYGSAEPDLTVVGWQIVYGDAHGNAIAKGNVHPSAIPPMKDAFSHGAVLVAWQSE